MARKILIWITKGIVFLYLFLAVILFLFDAFIQFRDNDKDLDQYFRARHINHAISYYKSHGRTIRYITVGNEDAPYTILFIHGAPSSISYFRSYLADDYLLDKAQLFAVDRPGYGYSGFGNPEPSIEKQAEIIRPILDSLHHINHPVIIVGVSYGTSVACRLAMDHPDLVDGLVLVAPALAPGEEKVPGIAHVIENPLFKWMIPRMFISANAEKLNHKKELEKMVPRWSKIHVPVIYLQGSEDGLVYPSNAIFAKQKLCNTSCLSIKMIPGRGHLIAFSEQKLIGNSIYDMLNFSQNYYNDKKTKSQQAAISTY
ncbi:MAG: alpha/beta hydrolase [Bacteroidetes bacterium]|nr:MAG: alpha/beta hydrolase [Bacteroidota bacterium]